MGLYSTLNDASSDSIPLLLVALVAHCVRYLRWLLLHFLQSTRLVPVDDAERESLFCAGLAGVMALAEQLNVSHRAFSCRDGDGVAGSECVVCLCRLRDGNRVRRLACGHVFHRECLDGWLDYSNFSCPLCRAPLVSEERVMGVERHVRRDLVTCFGPPIW